MGGWVGVCLERRREEVQGEDGDDDTYAYAK